MQFTAESGSKQRAIQHVHFNTVLYYEKGRTPDFLYLLKVIEVTKCDPVWLLLGAKLPPEREPLAEAFSAPEPLDAGLQLADVVFQFHEKISARAMQAGMEHDSRQLRLALRHAVAGFCSTFNVRCPANLPRAALGVFPEMATFDLPPSATGVHSPERQRDTVSFL
jgi:hypothetical protein